MVAAMDSFQEATQTDASFGCFLAAAAVWHTRAAASKSLLRALLGSFPKQTLHRNFRESCLKVDIAVSMQQNSAQT
jgi:hypothetical protein